MTATKGIAVASEESDLPEGWAKIELEQISAQIQYGYTASALKDQAGPRFLRITDIQNGKVDWNSVPTCEISRDDLRKYALRQSDVLFARTGATTGKSFLIASCPHDAVFASYLIRLRLQKSIDAAFVSLFFNTPEYWQFISENVAGIAQPNCNATKLGCLLVPIPPLLEQKRIVEKVERLLARVNVAKERLARVSAILKRFRQVVLAAVILGEETPLGDVLADVKYGTAKRCEPNIQGTPVLRIPNLVNGYIDHSELKYAELDQREESSLRLNRGDILLIRSNGSVDLLGKSAVVSEKEIGYAYAGYLIRLRVDPHKADPQYLQLALNTQDCRDQIEMPARSTSGVHNINSQEVRQLRILLPPIGQQREIVRRVGTLFKLADAIEKRLATATARAEKLTQAILAKAFRGELVPTEAELARREGRSYEPASALLARIRCDRDQSKNFSTKAVHEEHGRWHKRTAKRTGGR